MAKRTALIQWKLDDGSLRHCDSRCRRSNRQNIGTCPCTGLCKGMRFQEAVNLLKDEGVLRAMINYAEALPGVVAMRVAPEIKQLEIVFGPDGSESRDESHPGHNA